MEADISVTEDMLYLTCSIYYGKLQLDGRMEYKFIVRGIRMLRNECFALTTHHNHSVVPQILSIIR